MPRWMAYHHEMAAHERDERSSNLYSKDTINIFMCATTVARSDVSLFSSIHRVCGCIAFLLFFFVRFALARGEGFGDEGGQALYVSLMLPLLPHIDIYCCVNLFWFQIAKKSSDRCVRGAVPAMPTMCHICPRNGKKNVFILFSFLYRLAKAKTITPMEQTRVGNNWTANTNLGKKEIIKYPLRRDARAGQMRCTHKRWKLLQC